MVVYIGRGVGGSCGLNLERLNGSGSLAGVVSSITGGRVAGGGRGRGRRAGL